MAEVNRETMSGDTKAGAFASLLDGFGPVQRVLLFIGFVVCAIGIRSGLTFQNRTVMAGTALLMAGFAGHYFREIRTPDVSCDGESVRGEIIWGNVFLAIVFSFLCATASWFAYFGH